MQAGALFGTFTGILQHQIELREQHGRLKEIDLALLTNYERFRKLLRPKRETSLTMYAPSNDQSGAASPYAHQMSSLLNRLPDDILHLIVENIYTGHDQGTYHIILSHVCRRLRHIVLNTPRLWSTVDSWMSPHNVRLYLARSEKAGLTVLLRRLEHRNDAVERLDKFLGIVANESERWVGFEFVPVHIPHWRETFKTLLKHLQHRPVPRLKRMCIKMPQSYSWLFADSDVPHTLLQFYSTWVTPQLTRLIVENTVPPPQFGKTLTSFELHLEATMGFIHEWSLADLHAFLSTCESLQHLTLRLESLGADASAFELSTIVLPTLRSYRVTIASDRATTAFLTLTSVLHIPILSSWHVTFGFDEEDGTSQSLLVQRLLQSPLNEFNMLKEFSLTVHCNLREAFPLHSIFTRLRSLHHLKIEVTRAEFPPAFELRTESDSLSPPPLRSLALSKCPKMGAEYFKDLMTTLKAGESWPEFKLLRIRGCWRVNEEDIQAIVPEYVSVCR